MRKLLLVTIFSAALTAAASISPRTASASDWAQLVECWSDANCQSTLLSSICTGGWASNISCTNVASASNPSNCGNGLSCKQVWSQGPGQINLNNTTIGTWCRDGSGFDAIVWCHNNN